MKINATGRSANSKALEAEYLIWIADGNESFGLTTNPWLDFIIKSNHKAGFNFSGINTLTANINSTTLYSIDIQNGKKYSGSLTSRLSMSGIAGSINEIDVSNEDSTYDMNVYISRNRRTMHVNSIPAGETMNFSMRRTFFIYTTSDLNYIPDYSDANTEISTIGIKSATVNITGTGPYSMSLTNIVMA